MSDFPYLNRSGRMMYDASGNCVNCGHHSRFHNRRCEHFDRATKDRCDCWYESPRQDQESALAGALWRAFTR